MASTAGKPAGVKRVVYRQVLAGDRRKFAAQSNDSPTGGGARDMRFNHEHFGPIFRLLLPRTDSKIRRRNGVATDLTIWCGTLRSHYGDQQLTAQVEYEPPTDARGAEGRLARVHQIPGLAGNLPDDTGDTLFVLFVQQDNDDVYSHFVTLGELNGWHQAVRDPIQQCAAAPRRANIAIAGWINFASHSTYCHT